MPLLTRRAFCSAAVAVSASAAAGARRGPVAPTARLTRLGVQAGVIRPLLTADFDGTLARLAALGYATLELQWYSGNFGRTPAGLDGHVPYDEFLARTDPAQVALSMDPANMVRGGADPLPYLRAHRERYRLGHLKDVTGDDTVGGVFGDGRVPMADVVSALSDVASRHQFIEHPLRAGREFDDLLHIKRRLEAMRA